MNELLIYWPVIAGAAVVLFGAGGAYAGFRNLQGLMRNGIFVTKSTFEQFSEKQDERWQRIQEDIREIKDTLKNR